MRTSKLICTDLKWVCESFFCAIKYMLPGKSLAQTSWNAGQERVFLKKQGLCQMVLMTSKTSLQKWSGVFLFPSVSPVFFQIGTVTYQHHLRFLKLSRFLNPKQLRFRLLILRFIPSTGPLEKSYSTLLRTAVRCGSGRWWSGHSETMPWWT